jgi:hypothetical protein
MNPKTRLITIRRTITQIVEEKGKQVEKKVQKNFPCRVNAGVPYSHHICEHG